MLEHVNGTRGVRRQFLWAHDDGAVFDAVGYFLGFGRDDRLEIVFEAPVNRVLSPEQKAMGSYSYRVPAVTPL